MTIQGLLTSLHVIPGRDDTCVVAVHSNVFGGQFNCSPLKVTLDGATPKGIAEVAAFVSSRNCVAVVREIDNTQAGVGVRPCEGVDLVTME